MKIHTVVAYEIEHSGDLDATVEALEAHPSIERVRVAGVNYDQECAGLCIEAPTVPDELALRKVLDDCEVCW